MEPDICALTPQGASMVEATVTFTGWALVTLAANCSVPPASVTVPELTPSAELLFTAKMPALTTVPPV